MGASISVTVTSPEGAGEPYGDLHITGDALFTVPPSSRKKFRTLSMKSPSSQLLPL
jgi:hypothetical protein